MSLVVVRLMCNSVFVKWIFAELSSFWNSWILLELFDSIHIYMPFDNLVLKLFSVQLMDVSCQLANSLPCRIALQLIFTFLFPFTFF